MTTPEPPDVLDMISIVDLYENDSAHAEHLCAYKRSHQCFGHPQKKP